MSHIFGHVLTYVFHFTKLEKLCLFLGARSNSKKELLKPKAMLSMMVTRMVVTMFIVNKG